MSSLAEVGGARVRRKARPESVDDLLPLQPMPRRQGEQLHKLGRTPLLPCLSGDATSVYRDLEPTEEADLDARHVPRILPTTPADKDASTTPTPRWKRGVASQSPFGGEDGGQPPRSASDRATAFGGAGAAGPDDGPERAAETRLVCVRYDRWSAPGGATS